MRQKITLLTKTMLLLCALVAVSGSAWAEDITISVDMTTYVSENNCTVSSGSSVTNYYSLQLDNNITLSVNEGGNNGSFWGTSTIDWRLYRGQNAVATLTAKTGYELKSVTFTFTTANNSAFYDADDNALTSGTAVSLSGASASFTPKNTNNKTNGQTKITAVSVTYASTSSVASPTFNVEAGTVSKGTEVTISATTGCTLSYTTDGTNPSESATAILTPGNTATVTINSSTTIRAIALDSEANESSESSATYTVVKPSAGLEFAETSFSVAIGSTFTAPTLTNPHSLPVTYSSNNESVATVNENTGAVVIGFTKGTAIITAHVDETNDYAEGEASYTIVVYDPNNMSVEKNSFGSGETSGKIENLIEYVSYQGDAGTAPGIYDEGIRLYQAPSSGKYGGYITLTAPAGYAITGFTITTTSKYSSTTVTYNIDGSLDITENSSYSLAASSDYTIDNLFNKSVSIFCIGTGSNYRLEIGAIKVTYTTTTAKVTSAGWATFIPSYDAQFASGDAYVVTAASVDDGLTVEGVTSVPAGTPVLLKGTQGSETTKTITLLAETPSAPATNLLSVCDGTVTSGYPYVLAKNGEGACFKQWTGAASALENRVVLVLDEAVATARSIFMLDDEATGIENIEQSSLTIDQSVYNLNGQRVVSPQRGLYIVGGKKVMIK